ncbi:hypothetical protein QJS10_CPB18g02117 [Acorus calamus]|uniref:Uncharacterized protein n=1 Tax=Acorus calamus TaxID=4465 RepID=A0AAV9CKW1_ACOCL|nr:hypothetical protein QJS10_CPB18g02117 [Acorus calamus]
MGFATPSLKRMSPLSRRLRSSSVSVPSSVRPSSCSLVVAVVSVVQLLNMLKAHETSLLPSAL